MIRIDNSLKDEYYSQVNNKRFPFSACNVTSGIMFLRSNRIPYTIPTQEQDEDYLMWMLRQPDAYAHMETIAKFAVRDTNHIVKNWDDQADVEKRYRCPPSEVWECLAWGINRLAGADICACNFKLRLNEFLFELVSGRTMICGGKFTMGGHFVNTVGLMTHQDDVREAKISTDVKMSEVSCIIVDDPYGNYMTRDKVTGKYTDHRGNSVEIPIELYLDVVASFRNPAYGPPKYRLYTIMKK